MNTLQLERVSTPERLPYQANVHHALGANTVRTMVERTTLPSDVYEKFEENGYVKSAPHFEDIVHDSSRETPVTYIGAQQEHIGSYTEESDGERITVSEHEAIQDIAFFLQDTVAHSQFSNDQREAQKMLETMTFIGRKEYDEASQGIADYWKTYLARDPDAQLAIMATMEHARRIKSDNFFVDNILGHFTDEEMSQFADRIQLNPGQLSTDPEHTKVVLMDDWVIDGIQLGLELEKLIRRLPEYKDSIEVQLLVAPQDRIEEGLASVSVGTLVPMDEVPVKAYYVTDFDDEDQAITGFHSSSDHNFNKVLANMAKRSNRPMPAGTNVVRPYRMPGVKLSNIDRLRAIQQLNNVA